MPLTWLSPIRERVEKATPGPWICRQRCVDAKPDDDESCGLGCEIGGPPEPALRGQFSRGADGQFIAHAREDMERYAKAVELLMEAVETAVARMDAPEGIDWVDAASELRRVLAEVEGLGNG